MYEMKIFNLIISVFVFLSMFWAIAYIGSFFKPVQGMTPWQFFPVIFTGLFIQLIVVVWIAFAVAWIMEDIKR